MPFVPCRIRCLSYCVVQTELTMRDSLVVLRQENSQLSMEIIELKGHIGLRDDQVRSCAIVLNILTDYIFICCLSSFPR